MIKQYETTSLPMTAESAYFMMKGMGEQLDATEDKLEILGSNNHSNNNMALLTDLGGSSRNTSSPALQDPGRKGDLAYIEEFNKAVGGKFSR